MEKIKFKSENAAREFARDNGYDYKDIKYEYDRSKLGKDEKYWTLPKRASDGRTILGNVSDSSNEKAKIECYVGCDYPSGGMLYVSANKANGQYTFNINSAKVFDDEQKAERTARNMTFNSRNGYKWRVIHK